MERWERWGDGEMGEYGTLQHEFKFSVFPKYKNYWGVIQLSETFFYYL
jgi:hypothetical protein